MNAPYLSTAFGDPNNVISVGGFTLHVPFWWHMFANEVAVRGTFNDWGYLPMNKLSHSLFYQEAVVPLGKIQFKYNVGDRWLYDDQQPHDYFNGSLNNIHEVRTGQSELFYFKSRQSQLGLHYWSYLPKEYTNGEKWPLILYLHCIAERGDDPTVLEKHGLPKELKIGRQLPFIVISPQCCGKMVWSNNDMKAYLAELIDHFSSTRNVDQRRIYVIGDNMGGNGTWSLAIDNPNKFAAIAPINGVSKPALVSSLKHLPVWTFINKKETLYADMQNSVEALQNVGGNIQCTHIEEVGSAYASDQLFDWFLQHSKPE